jgi:hypothetical protein
MDGQCGRLHTAKFHREFVTCGPRGIDSLSLVGSLQHPLPPIITDMTLDPSHGLVTYPASTDLTAMGTLRGANELTTRTLKIPAAGKYINPDIVLTGTHPKNHVFLVSS